MDRRCGKQINVIATGFIVLVLFSLVLFWARFICWKNLIDNIPSDSRSIIIRPTGLIPGELASTQVKGFRRYSASEPGPKEPNHHFSEVSCELEPGFVFLKAIGALKIVSTPYDMNEKIFYTYKDKDNYLCLDKHSGLIIKRRECKVKESNGEFITRSSNFFAGPEGVSLNAEPSLGRFYDPIMGDIHSDIFWVYDRKFRQFYFVNFAEGVVRKGLQLENSDPCRPVAIEIISSWPYYNGGGIWSPPMVWNADNHKWENQRLFLPGDSQLSEGRICSTYDPTHTYVHLLDKTGWIYIYNSRQQSLTCAGYLPRPALLFASNQFKTRPEDVLAYKVLPVYAILRTPSDLNKPPESIDIRYLGMNVSCISREGTAMKLMVFDSSGKGICGGTTYEGITTAEAIYSGKQVTHFAAVIEFLLENLQPVVFEITSFLCGDYIDASAGHRALFILPNSFVGMLGRYSGTHFDREVFLPILMGPSLILSLWLAVRVRKDATLVGLSRRATTLWAVGTMAFGLPAYITYRLTRHKDVLVTCQNCGRMRRPDMQTCHHCGSKWEMPELMPPNWRICD
jgi:hypothetical protein